MISYEPAAAPPTAAFRQDAHFIGSNYILVCTILPYTLATALQDTHIRAACVAGTACAGGLMLLGLLFRLMGGRRIWPYIVEMALLTVFAVQLIVVYVRGGMYEASIVRYFPFITNGALGGITLVCVLFNYPWTIQNVREVVPRTAWRHPAVTAAAHVTSAVWVLVFTLNTLMYLAPFIAGEDTHHSSTLNLLFRIILPILLFVGAAVFTRMWPLTVEAHLLHSLAFDSSPRKIMINQVYAVDNYA